jgi:hypothetical protein
MSTYTERSAYHESVLNRDLRPPLLQEQVNDFTGATVGACDWILETVLTLKPGLDSNHEKMPGQPT